MQQLADWLAQRTYCAHAKSLDPGIKLFRFEIDWNAELIDGGGERKHAGKGLGTKGIDGKDGCLTACGPRNTVRLLPGESPIQEAKHDRVSGTSHNGITVVEEQSTALRLREFGKQHGRSAASGEPGTATKEVEQLHANGLTRVSLLGAYVQIRSNRRCGETVSGERPQREDGKLAGGTC